MYVMYFLYVMCVTYVWEACPVRHVFNAYMYLMCLMYVTSVMYVCNVCYACNACKFPVCSACHVCNVSNACM